MPSPPAGFALFLFFCRARVQRLVQDGFLMVTWANHHYVDFARSWVSTVRKCGITGYMVGAMVRVKGQGHGEGQW
jgi:hypothetical protein